MHRSLLLLALIAAPAAGEGVHGLSATQFDAWLKSLAGKKKRPVLVNAHPVAGKGVFAGIAAANPDGVVWTAKQGQTAAAYNARHKQLTAEGHRLECVSIYHVPAGPRYTDLWVKDKAVPFTSRVGVTEPELRRVIDDQAKAGSRPVCLNGYLDERGAVRFAAVFHKVEGAEFQTHAAATEMEFQKLMLDYKAKGWRPSAMSAFHDGRGVRVNFVAEKVGGGWALQHGVTAGVLTKDHETHAKEGLVAGAVSGYPSSGGSRYSAFWVQPGVKPVKPVKVADMEATGTEVPALAGFDRAMMTYMRERDIEAGALCVMRGGKVVLSRGYGFLTRDRKKTVPPDAPFRIADLTRPITAALIHDLVRQGKFKLTDSAFTYISATPPAKTKADPRLKDVTIQHLLDHKGGFDRNLKPLLDPMFQTALVRKQLALEDPPTPADMVRFMAGRRLDFAPGSRVVQSNFGYCVLGRVIEKATGETYPAAVKKFLAPLGIKGVGLGRTQPDDRDPAEPFYFDAGFATNVITGSGNVPVPDGGFNLEAMDSCQGLVCSAPDLARFLNAYWLNSGQPRKGGAGEPSLVNGGLPGTWSVARQRADGVNIVALFNQRHRRPESINDMLNLAADEVKEWP